MKLKIKVVDVVRTNQVNVKLYSNKTEDVGMTRDSYICPHYYAATTCSIKLNFPKPPLYLHEITGYHSQLCIYSFHHTATLHILKSLALCMLVGDLGYVKFLCSSVMKAIHS